MTEFGLWWIGFGIFFVVGFFFICVAATTDDKRKNKQCAYTTGYIGITNTCIVVMGIDCFCAVWAGKLGGVTFWYILTAVLSGLVGLVTIIMQFSERKSERDHALQSAPHLPYQLYTDKVNDIVAQLHATTRILEIPSAGTYEYESQRIKGLQKDRQQLREDVKKAIGIKKGYAVRTTWSIVVTLITLAAVVCSCLMADKYIPKTNAYIFKKTNAVYELNEDGDYVVVGQTDNAKKLVISAIYNAKKVVGIGEGAFRDRTGLEEVVIMDGLQSIGNSAFEYCTSLKTITIPGSVAKIGESAFESCTALTNVNISNGVEIMGSHAFTYCEGLTKVDIPNSVTLIARETFYNCRNLKSITYDGTRAQWEAIAPNFLFPADDLIIICNDGKFGQFDAPPKNAAF